MRGAAVLADSLWRAATYVSVCQLHLRGNVLLSEPLAAEHVKAHPSGHWGTVPGTAWALTHIALAAGRTDADQELVPLIGAGHAGVVQLSLAWLSGQLAAARPQFARDVNGLTRLCRAFPDVDGLGAEVTPSLLAGDYLGGRLGGAFAFAQGAGMDAPHRILVPVIGDGECETPATSAAWLAWRALPGTKVLPVIHVNGFRMGGASLFGAMDDDQLVEYAIGHGWQAAVAHVSVACSDEHAAFQHALRCALQKTGEGEPTALFLRCTKGWGGPESVGGRRIIGTPRVHKTPLPDPHGDAPQRQLLERWLAAYRAHDLFDSHGHPTGALAEALDAARWCALRSAGSRGPTVRPARRNRQFDTFAAAVSTVVRDHAATGDFRVFSPDELASNRLDGLVGEPWVTELLAEEVLLECLAGWTASRRRGVLISYEAFASLLSGGMVAHLKQRRLAGAPSLPSLNLLLTSYGWHNTFTHGDPSLATSLLAMADPAVHVLTPADPTRTAAALHRAFSSYDQANVVIAGKHPTARHRLDTVDEELSRGLAIWPHLSDLGEPDLTIVTAGDLPAKVTAAAIPLVDRTRECRVRVVNLLDLTVLGDPRWWPRGLKPAEADRYFGFHAPLLVVTLGHPAAVWGLLQGRLKRPVEVIGWREPAGPMPQHQLARTLGLDLEGVRRAAARLLRTPEAIR